MRVPLTIDRRAKTPLQRQIYDGWRSAILAGRLRRGERVPSTRELAAAFGLSRTTVTAAYEQLIGEGYFDAAHGSGTFVCRELPEERLRAGGTRAAVTQPRTPRLSAFAARLTGDLPAPVVTPGVIDLSRLSPDIHVFPFALWRRLAVRHLRRPAAELFDYASAAGLAALRHEIAAYLARSRAVTCAPDQVIIVSGSQQALDLCARLFVNPGDAVVTENPGYLRAHQLFTAYGAAIDAVRVGSDGIDPRDFARSARVVYVTPSHQFPTGVSMSLTRRLELLEWARAHGAALIEDDYDSEYRYGGAPLPALQGLARDVPVIYVGTFSKVMFPGLRLGYVVVPRDLVATFTRAKLLADRQSGGLDQAVLADFLAGGHLERHIRRMRRLYQRRREVLLEALERWCGGRITIYGDAAGMHVMLRLAGAAATLRAARPRVRIQSAAPFYVADAPADEIVLGFSAIGERAIRAGVRLL